MNAKEFETTVESQFARCRDIMIDRAKQYATEDRLHNFKVAADLQCTFPTEALAGMMAKHTVSVYDMCRKDERQDIDLWHEKITDHICYLLLLRAIVDEQEVEARHSDTVDTFTMYADNQVVMTGPMAMEMRKALFPSYLPECDPNSKERNI